MNRHFNNVHSDRHRILRSSRDWLGSQAAFEKFYDAHAHDVFRYFFSRTYDEEAALDLTAETFLQAFAGRRKFRGAGDGEATSWLFGIARHLHNRYLRRGYAEQELIARLQIHVPTIARGFSQSGEFTDQEHLRQVVAGELSRLRPDQRRAVELRVIDDLSYSEVAQRLGVSEKAARMRLARALERLGPRLEEFHNVSQSQEASL
jgi:RNA polymerase sigma-70 factor (ECF subfamily)